MAFAALAIGCLGENMGEEMPAPGDFEQWLKPREALELLPSEWGRGHAINAIVTNLKVGGLRSSARAGRLMSDDGCEQVAYFPIPPIYWDELEWINGPETLWVTGQVSFHIGSRTNQRPAEDWIEHIFTDVRFDPEGFAVAFDLDQTGNSQSSKALPVAEAERFARAILHGWPDTTERNAYAKAVLFFPDHRVSRDPFLKIFRSIRGYKSPGKPSTD
ncbi:MAG: hypothetical protein GW858_14635 [Sphingomonadales bacterium]|nr:hypothetical protein [Sphingomonadales bacterium]